jgi:hypothetical protein
MTMVGSTVAMSTNSGEAARDDDNIDVDIENATTKEKTRKPGIGRQL